MVKVAIKLTDSEKKKVLTRAVIPSTLLSAAIGGTTSGYLAHNRLQAIRKAYGSSVPASVKTPSIRGAVLKGTGIGAVSGLGASLAGLTLGSIVNRVVERKNMTKTAIGSATGLLAFPIGMVVGASRRQNKIDKTPVRFNGQTLPYKDLKELRYDLLNQLIPSGNEVWAFYNSLPEETKNSITVGDFDNLFLQAAQNKLSKTAAVGSTLLSVLGRAGLGAAVGGGLGYLTGSALRGTGSTEIKPVIRDVQKLKQMKEKGIKSLDDFGDAIKTYDPFTGLPRKKLTPAYMVPYEGTNLYPDQAEHNLAIDKGFYAAGGVEKMLEEYKNMPLKDYLAEVLKRVD